MDHHVRRAVRKGKAFTRGKRHALVPQGKRRPHIRLCGAARFSLVAANVAATELEDRGKRPCHQVPNETPGLETTENRLVPRISLVTLKVFLL